MKNNEIKIHDYDERAVAARRHNWSVMKPFVIFSFKALSVIGSALISLVKHIPKHEPQHSPDQRISKR